MGEGCEKVDTDVTEAETRIRCEETRKHSQGLDIVTVLCYTALILSPLGGGRNVHFDLRDGEAGGAETP